jgi:hypothetical protein
VYPFHTRLANVQRLDFILCGETGMVTHGDGAGMAEHPTVGELVSGSKTIHVPPHGPEAPPLGHI